MANVSPNNLVIRCYGHRVANGQYVGVCIDLNVAVQGDSPDMLKKKMAEAIVSYLETVLDTEDTASVPYLLSRKAPVRDWIIYYLIKFACFIKEFPDNFFRFKQYFPFQLNHG